MTQQDKSIYLSRHSRIYSFVLFASTYSETQKGYDFACISSVRVVLNRYLEIVDSVHNVGSK